MKTLHDLVADKLERDPSFLPIPLENINRWIARGHTAPHRLEQWRQIILRAQQSPEGLRELLPLLRDRCAETERLPRVRALRRSAHQPGAAQSQHRMRVPFLKHLLLPRGLLRLGIVEAPKLRQHYRATPLGEREALAAGRNLQTLLRELGQG
jgi:hypothetical protein